MFIFVLYYLYLLFLLLVICIVALSCRNQGPSSENEKRAKEEARQKYIEAVQSYAKAKIQFEKEAAERADTNFGRGTKDIMRIPGRTVENSNSEKSEVKTEDD